MIPKHSINSRATLLFFAVLALFLVSGASGLLYQVVWTRKLVLLFGTTAYAVSTVLTVFFLGLGIGSLWGGRIADRHANPLRLYAILEILIGVWALFFLLAIGYGEDLIAALLRATHNSRALGLSLRALLALLLIFPPVFMMGATLPLLARFVNRDPRVRGAHIGALYTINTLGAAAGCFLTGFYLIPEMGYTRATLFGAFGNLFAGAVAMLLSTTTRSDRVTSPSREAATNFSLNPVAIAFFLSGFCALALEVLWTRLLAMIFLGTTYAYSTMLTTLLVAIVAGSGLASFMADRTRSPRAAFGWTLAFAGALCLVQLRWFEGLPEAVNTLQQQHHDDWPAAIRGTFYLAFLTLFPPMFFLGASFPFAVKAYARRGETVGGDVGRLYFVNTIGGVFGAAAGGYLLIPLLGTHASIVALSTLLLLGGLALAVTAPVALKSRTALAVVSLALAAVGLARAPHDVSRALNAGYIPKDHRVIHYNEGVEGTVAVSEPQDEEAGTNRVLWINRVQATTSIERGVRMNRFQGALPLLFDRDIKNVLFMCFGSGITCGTLAAAGFPRIDAVEISYEVLEAAPLFANDNLRVWEQPNVKFHHDDGRNFLLTTDTRYDFITFEPMPLALAGVSTFYTKEYYELCLSRLNPGGLVSQWVPLHSLNAEVVRSLVHTFTRVFPEYCAFFINADLFLIGSDAPIGIDFMEARLRISRPELREALEAVGFPDLESIAATFLMSRQSMSEYAAQGRVMSDDLPWAEFLAPKLVYERSVPKTITELQPYAANPQEMFVGEPTPQALEAFHSRHAAHIHDLEALKEYYGGLAIGTKAAELFMESLRIDPNDTNAQYYLQQIAEQQAERMVAWEEYEKARDFIVAVLELLPTNAKLHGFLADAYTGLGDTAAAETHRQRAGAFSNPE